MVKIVCNECGTELETVVVKTPLPDGGTTRRERTYCPACDFGTTPEEVDDAERTVSIGDR